MEYLSDLPSSFLSFVSLSSIVVNTAVWTYGANAGSSPLEGSLSQKECNAIAVLPSR